MGARLWGHIGAEASENTDNLGLFLQTRQVVEGLTADLLISFGQLEQNVQWSQILGPKRLLP